MYCSGNEDCSNEHKRNNSRNRSRRELRNNFRRSNRLGGQSTEDGKSSTFDDLLSIFDSESDTDKSSDSESQSSDSESQSSETESQSSESGVINYKTKQEKGLRKMIEQSVPAIKFSPSASSASTSSASTLSTPSSSASSASTLSTPSSSASSAVSDSPPSSPISDSLSDESTEGEPDKILVITCSECDNIAEVIKYLKQQKIKEYNLVTIAGGSLGYNCNKLWQKCMNNQIEFFKPPHILIIDHEPCSIYKKIYNKSFPKGNSKNLKKNILSKLHKFNEEKTLAAIKKKFPSSKCRHLRLQSKGDC